MTEPTTQMEPMMEAKPPLKPRQGVFYALLIGFFLWVAFLVWMYATTEYPAHL